MKDRIVDQEITLIPYYPNSDVSLAQVKANIYSFNTQSQKMFMSVGFQRESEEWFFYRLEADQLKRRNT